jgi:hypothetical protein
MELLNRENTGLLVIDVQQKLMEVMRQKQGITENIIKLLHLSKLFNLPVILTEHYPRWLGPTLKEIQEFLPTYEPITKMHFDCCDADAVLNHTSVYSRPVFAYCREDTRSMCPRMPLIPGQMTTGV